MLRLRPWHVVTLLIAIAVVLSACDILLPTAPPPARTPLPTWTRSPTPPPPATAIATRAPGGLTQVGMNFRTGPGDACEVIRRVEEGTRFYVLARDESCQWIKARLLTDEVGWLWADYVETDKQCEEWPVVDETCP